MFKTIKRAVSKIKEVRKSITDKIHEFFAIPTVNRVSQGIKNIISVLFLVVGCGATLLFVLGTGRLIVIATGMFWGAIALTVIWGGLWLVNKIYVSITGVGKSDEQ